MNISKRLDKIESEIKDKMPYVSPPMIFEREGVFTSKDHEVLTKDANGNLLLEDGSVFYQNQNLPNGLVGLITVSFV